MLRQKCKTAFASGMPKRKIRLGFDVGPWSDYDWSPLPEEQLRHRAAELGKQIARDEDAYLRQRLAEIAYEVFRPKRELAAARIAVERAVAALRRDRQQQKRVRDLLGIGVDL